ncbi:MAG: PaaI family thioesterase [Alphaproteobacteria bacterium]|nr:MAG: PaaI family thioesterase [Alphaproteobacteria bacterium]
MTETGGPGGPDPAQIAQVIAEAIPFSRALGIRLTEAGPGFARLAIAYDERLVGDPKTGVLHGGVVTALLDSCCGSAVMLHPSRPAGTATMDLRIDYMRASTPGATLNARAECYRVTRHVAFVRGIAFETDESDPVAVATGAFTIERGEGREGAA